MQKINVLIDNCEIANGGDAALNFTLEDKIQNKTNVTINTWNYKEVSSRYKERKFSRAIQDFPFMTSFLRSTKLRYLVKFFLFIYVVILPNKYKKMDLIVNAPGGYINSHYGFFEKVYIPYLLKKYLGKTVGMYSQSYGPFNSCDEKIVSEYVKCLDFVFARDTLSGKRMVDLGLTNVTITEDAAFMLNDISKVVHKPNSQKIAISMREWSLGDVSEEKYFNIIQDFIEYAIGKGYEVTFLSTNQGIPGQIDDSIIVKKFIEKRGFKNNLSVKIDDKFHTIYELQNMLQTFDFVVGTRLHMCILALINKTPAFNISYEEKGTEAYKYLKISEFSIDYNEKSNYQDNIEKFFNLSMIEKDKIFSNVASIQKRQEKYIKKMLNISYP